MWMLDHTTISTLSTLLNELYTNKNPSMFYLLIQVRREFMDTSVAELLHVIRPRLGMKLF